MIAWKIAFLWFFCVRNAFPALFCVALRSQCVSRLLGSNTTLFVVSCFVLQLSSRKQTKWVKACEQKNETASSLSNILVSIKTHLHSIYHHTGMQSNNTNNNINDLDEDGEVEAELLSINQQLQELDDFMKNKFHNSFLVI